MIRKTKIVCTLGPAIDSVEALTKMIEAGMNVARLNFSHLSNDDALVKIENVRKAEKIMNKPIPIMLDTKGPEIRIGLFENGEAKISKGDIIKILPNEIIGNNKEFSISYPELYNAVPLNWPYQYNNLRFAQYRPKGYPFYTRLR